MNADCCETIVISEPAAPTFIVGAAEQGPPGPPGPAGGESFVYPQTVPAMVWTVPHNLNRWPSVTVVNNIGEKLIADVQYVDSNIIQVTHNAPTVGRVFCN